MVPAGHSIQIRSSLIQVLNHQTRCYTRHVDNCHNCQSVRVAAVAMVCLTGVCRCGTSSSQYHLGKKPTLSSPLTTSSTSDCPESNCTLTPELGTNLTRHTDEEDTSLPAWTTFLKKVMKRWPQSKQISGSQASGFPRTRRGK